MPPYQIISAREVPGVGQIKSHIIEDDITWAEYALETGGAAYAYTNFKEALVRQVEMKTWRSAAASDILQRLERILFSEITENIKIQQDVTSSRTCVPVLSPQG